ncbi:SDR family oxidoreductase, partial [Streptomyces sp. NPDC059949]|uniref:SDR family oxidoreductase n=1 Tax=Streptomyces sp. NPDC059949 TaxID=3347013 RepID=UPI00364FBC23
MATVLVTGATGNVGSKVATELRARGISVRAFVRDPDRAAAVLGGRIEMAHGDFADPASVRRALDGVERMFLLCANDPRQVEY